MPKLPSLLAAALVACAYLLIFGAVLLQLHGQPGLLDVVICFAPAVAGVVLAATSQSDRRQYIARVFAAALFLPILLLMWASSEPVNGWHLALLAVLHVGALLALVLWLAGFTTRIPAVTGVPVVGGAAFARRLEALARSSHGRFAVTAGAASHTWHVELRAEAASGRRHRLTLTLDEAAAAVRVREFASADGANPSSESERSMRGPGDPYFDPTRPDAQAVWNRTWQATMVELERLESTLVEFQGDEVRYVLPASRPIDDDAVITLFALVTTRSGYAWLPGLFGK